MFFVNWVGVILIIIGTSVQISGHYSQPILEVAGLVLIALGVALLATGKYILYKEEKEFNFGGRPKNTSLPLMGDVFNITGQRTGGRSDDWTSGDSSGGEADGGGGD